MVLFIIFVSKCKHFFNPFQCSGCDKVFVGEQFLLAHQQRRHPGLLGSEQILNTQSKEVESLRRQVQELQDRLHVTEDALSRKQDPLIPDVNVLQAMLQSELQVIFKICLYYLNCANLFFMFRVYRICFNEWLQKMKPTPTNTLSLISDPVCTEYSPPQQIQPEKPEKPERCLKEKNSNMVDIFFFFQ